MKPKGRVALFPGSFDPPTAAHSRIVRSTFKKGRFSRLLVVLDTENVDKASHTASLANRIALCSIAFRKEPRVLVAVSTHGRFLEKAGAVRRAGWVRGRVPFVVGSDTMERILLHRFYRRPNREIANLMQRARFIVFPRGPIASSRARRSLKRGGAPLGDVTPEVLLCASQSGLYHPSRRPSIDVVTSFLVKGDRMLVLLRSARVGTFRGSWAGVSGFLEWPLSRTRALLEGRIGRAEIRRQALRQALREIREETGLGRGRVALLRRHAPMRFPDREKRRDWIVHPFLFRVDEDATIRLDWESDEGRWIRPDEIARMRTVPGLARVLRALRPYPGRGSERRTAT